MQIQLAGCVIVDEYDRILLLHRNTSKQQQWELPGGKVEEGEEPEEAAVRELEEELGLRVELIAALGATDFEIDEREFHYTWFQARIVEGEPRLMEPATFDDFDYVEYEDLPALALSANMEKLAAELTNGTIILQH